VTRHQRGYIFEASGAFYVRYYVVADGVRKQKSHRLCTKDRQTGCASTTAKAVLLLCEDFMRTINAEAPAEPSPLTVAEFWVNTYLPFIEAHKKHSTVVTYKHLWQQHLSAHFGTMQLREYRTPMMTKFLTDLAQRLQGRTLTNIKGCANSIFSHALAVGECDNNPIRDAMVLGKKLDKSVVKVYTLQEVEAVINALIDRLDCQLVMALAFFAGLRKGEIQGLQWGDYDGEVLHVQRAFCRGVLGTPKTMKSVRKVPVIAPLPYLLGQWATRTGGSGWVFPSTKPGSQTAADLGTLADDVIRPALEAAGVPWKGYHGGRRGLGTTLKALTGNSNAGRDMLGHSDERTTQAHYEDRMPEEVLRGMKMLEAKVGK
jgi:integrase